MGDLPGSPVVKTLCFHCRGARVRSLVGELRSHMPELCGQKKEKKKRLKWYPNKTLRLVLEPQVGLGLDHTLLLPMRRPHLWPGQGPPAQRRVCTPGSRAPRGRHPGSHWPGPIAVCERHLSLWNACAPDVGLGLLWLSLALREWKDKYLFKDQMPTAWGPHSCRASGRWACRGQVLQPRGSWEVCQRINHPRPPMQTARQIWSVILPQTCSLSELLCPHLPFG